LSILILIGSVAHAADLTMPVKGVYDGDTIYSNLCALPAPLNKVSVRIIGIDAPELRTKCLSEKALGYEAKAKLEEILAGQTTVIVKDIEWDKYAGRVNGRVFLEDGTDVAAKMIESGLARPYSGGTRESWCK
jgi:endonuclease YncB( thermonuclease family)